MHKRHWSVNAACCLMCPERCRLRCQSIDSVQSMVHCQLVHLMRACYKVSFHTVCMVELTFDTVWCAAVCRKSAHPGDEGRPQPPLPPADPRQPDDSDTRRRRNGSGDVDNRGNRDPCAGALRYRDLTNLELAFRMAQLRRRYPGFISEGLANDFVATGGEVDWQNHADFAAQTSESARGGFEQRGATNTFSSFGGGHSSGGGGSSW